MLCKWIQALLALPLSRSPNHTPFLSLLGLHQSVHVCVDVYAACVFVRVRLYVLGGCAAVRV